MTYKEQLQKEYEEFKSWNECPPDNKMQYLGSQIFDFTTYDSALDEYFGSKMCEVLEVILNEKTFEYIKNDDNYKNFIAMYNTPFLHDKLEWGTSIRGAWFDHGEFKIETTSIIIKNLNQFVSELLEWAKETN